ncbi:alpha/beta fold hydrolase [Paenibacillus sp. LMG 31460]|uniref:Alpha/beta fold hydrolase n=1 Tax=Paenibacillus germinis TaxID=2654979 RepID=A0ABX1ZA33_9BACL|nr:alpha/beta hydrolase [Paenibacillus germinis]NOU89134.1 alpha/beta fold hydrolase [Paenibacillus germinis]
MESITNSLTYNESVVYWKKYQKFFPEEMWLKETNLPTEEWWVWNDVHIHLDRMTAPNAKMKVMFIHGAGGNGRLLAPYALMLQQHGYDVVSPDLPPYGLSYTESLKTLDYRRWIDILTELIEQEIKRDGKPVVLLGTSIGGMLAYHTATNSKQVKGLIVTTFVDTSNPKVRDQVMKDPRAAGTKIPLRLLRTFLNMKPMVEPENFDICPVLLIHPEVDLMTPFTLSESFFNRLNGKKEYKILEGAGHFPIEQPGLEQMRVAVLSFLKELENE